MDNFNFYSPTEFVFGNMNDKFYLEGTQRVSIRGRIAHEIISNLLIHRDYSSQNSAKIIIEKDKITIENPNKSHYFGCIQPDFK